MVIKAGLLVVRPTTPDQYGQNTAPTVSQFLPYNMFPKSSFFCFSVHLVCTNFSDFAEQGRQTYTHYYGT